MRETEIAMSEVSVECFCFEVSVTLPDSGGLGIAKSLRILRLLRVYRSIKGLKALQGRDNPMESHGTPITVGKPSVGGRGEWKGGCHIHIIHIVHIHE